MSVVVVGSREFIGHAIASELARRHSVELRGVVRPHSVGDAATDIREFTADITDSENLRESFTGVDVAIHAASYVGRDPAACQAINVDGTRNVVQEVKRQGIRRLIYLSTASVLGSGPHRGDVNDSVRYRPESTASHSRAEAEELVLAAGGIVLRPNIVLGAGDRWFVPALRKFIRLTGRWVSSGSARLDDHSRGTWQACCGIGASEG